MVDANRNLALRRGRMGQNARGQFFFPRRCIPRTTFLPVVLLAWRPSGARGSSHRSVWNFVRISFRSFFAVKLHFPSHAFIAAIISANCRFTLQQMRLLGQGKAIPEIRFAKRCRVSRKNDGRQEEWPLRRPEALKISLWENVPSGWATCHSESRWAVFCRMQASNKRKRHSTGLQ